MSAVASRALALALAWLPAFGVADWRAGGHLKYQYTYTDFQADDLGAALGDDPAGDQSFEARLKADGSAGPWSAAVHYEVLGLRGDSVAVRRQSPALALLGASTPTGLPDDGRRLFDLTDTVTDRERAVLVHRLDRLSVGHSSGGRTVRFGRQALSWGNGLVFHPLDFINPFSPIAIDKDYKTGDDMLYAQWALATGGDLQAILLPRRDPATRDIESEEATYAAKLRRRFGESDVDLVVARHFDEGLAGIGWVRSIGGAVWRLDARYTDTESDRSDWSFVTNLDYSWVLGGKNYYGYVEYFRNGVGETERASYATPNSELAARLARGELFTLARDYGALGLQVELHPLVNVFGNLIWNMNDGSAFLQVRGLYDWKQNVQLSAGLNLGFGERGDEFGGIAVPGTGLFLAPGRSAYVRAAYYF